MLCVNIQVEKSNVDIVILKTLLKTLDKELPDPKGH